MRTLLLRLLMHKEEVLWFWLVSSRLDSFPLQIFFILLDGLLPADVTASASFHYIANPR